MHSQRAKARRIKPLSGKSLWWWVGLLLCWALVGWRGFPDTLPPVRFEQPVANQALQGRIPIRLTGRLETVRSVALWFAYAQDPETWFPLAQRRGLPADGLLAVWDTSTLTDGDYLLRVTYTTQTGQHHTVEIQVRVRNYTPIETATPSPTPAQASGSPGVGVTPSPTATPQPPTATPLPPNAATLAPRRLTQAWRTGAILAALFLALLGLYRAWRR